ncbi:MAG: regulatory protein RecX [Bacteroidales bacterium]|nr:regulatory protein RecX [Bacteroidales bacterium]
MNTDLYAWAAARCARQECSRRDISTKLVGKGATAAEAREVVDRLVGEGFIDDARYARAFVADKFRFEHWGRVKISYMLHLKGLPDNVVDEALQQIDEAQYAETLKDFLEGKLRTVRAATPYALRQKVARAAISRGFEPDLVFQALDLL